MHSAARSNVIVESYQLLGVLCMGIFTKQRNLFVLKVIPRGTLHWLVGQASISAGHCHYFPNDLPFFVDWYFEAASTKVRKVSGILARLVPLLTQARRCNILVENSSSSGLDDIMEKILIIG